MLMSGQLISGYYLNNLLMQSGDIHKAGGVLLKDRKFLLERHGGKDTYIVPGGKLEAGETAAEALVREFREEFGLEIKSTALEYLDTFSSPAVHSPDRIVHIETFLIKEWDGEITLHDGIEGVMWINSHNITEVTVSPTAVTYVLPMLKKMGLID